MTKCWARPLVAASQKGSHSRRNCNSRADCSQEQAPPSGLSQPAVFLPCSDQVERNSKEKECYGEVNDNRMKRVLWNNLIQADTDTGIGLGLLSLTRLSRMVAWITWKRVQTNLLTIRPSILV